MIRDLSKIHSAFLQRMFTEPHLCTMHCTRHCREPTGQKCIPSRELHSRRKISVKKNIWQDTCAKYRGGKSIREGGYRGVHRWDPGEGAQFSMARSGNVSLRRRWVCWALEEVNQQEHLCMGTQGKSVTEWENSTCEVWSGRAPAVPSVGGAGRGQCGWSHVEQYEETRMATCWPFLLRNGKPLEASGF